MLIALLKNDKVKLLAQDGVHVVSSYSSLKAQPAVYLKEALPDGTRSAFFSDIIEVNGIRVEYDESAHLLEALGPLRRIIHLPQVGDSITYTLVETDRDEEQVEADVKDLRLHARDNPSKSLQVKLENDTTLELTDIVNIQRKVGGGSPFDRSKFQHIYVDYLSYESESENK